MAKRHYNFRHGADGSFLPLHGKYNSPEHRSWVSMKMRCLNTNSRSYKNYGGRGITVCERWMEFAGFLSDMGQRPPGTSLDRIDNNGPYCKDNCRWATPKMQSNNTSVTDLINFRGNVKGISEWSRILGIGRTTIQKRLASGWSVEAALTTPIKHRMLTFGGVTLPLTQMARKHGICPRVLSMRLSSGFTVERAILQPVRKSPTYGA